MDIRQSMKIAKRSLLASPLALGLAGCGHNYSTPEEAMKHATYLPPVIGVVPTNLKPNEYYIGAKDQGAVTVQTYIAANGKIAAATAPVPNATGVVISTVTQLAGAGVSGGLGYAAASAAATKISSVSSQTITGKDATVNGSQTTFKGGLTENSCYSLADGGSSAQCGTTGSNAITPNFTGSNVGTSSMGSGLTLH